MDVEERFTQIAKVSSDNFTEQEKLTVHAVCVGWEC